MKTIDDAAQEYAESLIDNDYTIETEAAFKSGVEFAQRWIPVEEELPPEGEKVLTKRRREATYEYVVMNYMESGVWAMGIPDTSVITHWRPIELK